VFKKNAAVPTRFFASAIFLSCLALSVNLCFKRRKTVNDKKQKFRPAEKIKNDATIFLAHHRQFFNGRQCFYEWIARRFDFALRPESAFLLASANIIFDDKQLTCFISDDYQL